MDTWSLSVLFVAALLTITAAQDGLPNLFGRSISEFTRPFADSRDDWSWTSSQDDLDPPEELVKMSRTHYFPEEQDERPSWSIRADDFPTGDESISRTSWQPFINLPLNVVIPDEVVDSEEPEDEGLSARGYLQEEPGEPLPAEMAAALQRNCVFTKFPWETAYNLALCPRKAYLVHNRVQRGSGPLNLCPGQKASANALVLLGPWMDCPLVSEPEPCLEQKCAPQPFNRTCKAEVPVAPGSCCKKYYCGLGAPWSCEDEPCPEAPKSPSCVAFQDDYDCCPKYQCGGWKPGRCPPLEGLPADTALRPELEASCIGDYTCPGARKCCKRCLDGPAFCLNSVFHPREK